MADVALTIAASETDFFTAKALGSFTGASLATVVTGNTARVLAKRDLVVIPFALALLFSYVAAQIISDPRSLGDFLLVLLNGCLLFWTALGANQTLASVAKPQETGVLQRQGRRDVGWLDPWL